MKKLFLALCAVVALSCATVAKADIVDVVFDVSGIQSWDIQGDANNEIHFVDMGAGFDSYDIIGIGWDVNIEAFGASWRSEPSVLFVDSPIGLQLAPGTDDSAGGPTNYNSGGVLNLGDIDPTFPWNQLSNILTLEFFEGFDDVADAVDGQWVSGALIFRVQRNSSIPEPSTFALLGLGAIAAVSAVRRRVA